MRANGRKPSARIGLHIGQSLGAVLLRRHLCLVGFHFLFLCVLQHQQKLPLDLHSLTPHNADDLTVDAHDDIAGIRAAHERCGILYQLLIGIRYLLSFAHSVLLSGTDGCFNTDHVLLDQDFRRLGGLPADCGALIQWIAGTGAAQLLDNVLQTAAGNVRHTVGVIRQNQGGVHIPLVGDLCTGGLVLGGILPHLGAAGLHKADAVQLADLVLVDVGGIHILVGALPLRVLHQVILGVGMDDAHIVAVDLGSVLRLQSAHGLLDGVHGQIVVLALGGAAAHQIGAGSHRAVGVLDNGTGVQNVAGDGVQGASGLRGNQLGGLHHVVVDGCQNQHIGQGNVAAVLLHGGLQLLHVQALAVRGHAFGKGGGHLREGVILAELNGLAAVLGDGVLLAKLVMHKLRLCQVDQIVGVIGLHLRRQVLAVARLGSGVGLHVREDLHKHREHKQSVHRVASLLLSVKSDGFPHRSPSGDLRPVCRGQFGNIILHNNGALGRGSVFLRSCPSGADIVRYGLLRLCRGLAEKVIHVQDLVCLLHADASLQQGEEIGVGVDFGGQVEVCQQGVLLHGLRLIHPRVQLLFAALTGVIVLLRCSQPCVLLLYLLILPVLLYAHTGVLRSLFPERIVPIHRRPQGFNVAGCRTVAKRQGVQNGLLCVQCLALIRHDAALVLYLFQPFAYDPLYLGVEIRLIVTVDQILEGCAFVLLPGVRSRSLLSVDYLARFGLLGDVRPAIGPARLGSALSCSAGRPGSAAVKQKQAHCLDKNVFHTLAPLSFLPRLQLGTQIKFPGIHPYMGGVSRL
nr:MAG TPA: hypothetical protein [Caudoviricetes sp.]